MVKKLNSDFKVLEDKEFRKIATFIETKVGIKMPISKKLMLHSRLLSRLKALGLSSFLDYIDYIFSSEQIKNEESISLIDVITTNSTYFYREKNHFEYLTSNVIPDLLKKGISKINIWSAGCSSGDEAYSLLIEIEEFKRKNPEIKFDYSILATDISIKILQSAKKSVYSINALKEVSDELKKRYFIEESKTKPDYTVKPEFREKVHFQRLNLMEDNYGLSSKMDIIFCRNVLMYFDKATQEKVITQILKYIKDDGYLFLGHSETVCDKKFSLNMLTPTIYQKID